MSELYERIAKYRKQDKEYQTQLIYQFRYETTHPRKCLSCYIAGIRSCRFWTTGENCQQYEVGKIEQLCKRFK